MGGTYIDKQTGELKSCYLTTIDVLGPELEAIKSGGDTDTCISVGASTITKRILEYTERTGLDMTKMRGIGTDGAATIDRLSHWCRDTSKANNTICN